MAQPVRVAPDELANRIIDLTGSASKVVHRPLPVDDPVRRQPDITLAKNTLDWSPKIALDDGLRKTIAYFEGVLRSGESRPTP